MVTSTINPTYAPSRMLSAKFDRSNLNLDHVEMTSEFAEILSSNDTSKRE